MSKLLKELCNQLKNQKEIIEVLQAKIKDLEEQVYDLKPKLIINTKTDKNGLLLMRAGRE